LIQLALSARLKPCPCYKAIEIAAPMSFSAACSAPEGRSSLNYIPSAAKAGPFYRLHFGMAEAMPFQSERFQK
jgi:hypothetical protein